MQNLIAFLTKHFHWFLFLVLEAISVSLLFSYNSYQASVWISSANTVAGTVFKWQSFVEHFFTMGDVNQALTERNLLLEEEVGKLRQDYAALTGDTSILMRREMQMLSEYQLIKAKVVSNTVNRPDNLITIDKGRADGVQQDMGVACGNGVVGVVYLTGEHYSVVLPALNNRSRISCTIRSNNYFGYLTWNGGDPSKAYVEDVPRHAKVKRGDWVETSGYSSIFPPGISVGIIEKIFDSDDGLSYRLLVKLSTPFACLRDVCVIADQGLADRLRLQEAARDSMMLMPKQD